MYKHVSHLADEKQSVVFTNLNVSNIFVQYVAATVKFYHLDTQMLDQLPNIMCSTLY